MEQGRGVLFFSGGDLSSASFSAFFLSHLFIPFPQKTKNGVMSTATDRPSCFMSNVYCVIIYSLSIRNLCSLDSLLDIHVDAWYAACTNKSYFAQHRSPVRNIVEISKNCTEVKCTGSAGSSNEVRVNVVSQIKVFMTENKEWEQNRGKVTQPRLRLSDSSTS